MIVFDRVKNSTRNIAWGMINRVIGLIIPFFMRTLLIVVLGIQYVGLSTLFSSILQVLNLAEMGFSTAIVYSLYKPVAEGDTPKICALLNIYKKIYRVLGLIILAVGLIITPFIPKLIKGSYPQDISLYVLYYIYLGNTVLSYTFFAYKRVLFSVHQRNDIDDNITSCVHLVSYLIQAIFLLTFRNYYLYVIIIPLQTALINTLTAWYAAKRYPDYKPTGDLTTQEKRIIYNKLKNLCLHKFGNTLSNSFDSIIVSAFLGLDLVARYGNYYYVVSVVSSFLAILYASIISGLGNSIAVESIEKNYAIFQKLNFLNFWICTFCSCCLLCLYQPFMELWAGKENLLFFSSVICFTLFFYVLSSRKIVLTYKDAAGLWEADRWKPIVGGVFNLIINIVLVKLIGINGVVLSTVLSHILIELPWETCALFKCYFKCTPKQYFFSWLKNILITLLICIITYWICSRIELISVMGIVARFLICCAVPNLLLFLLFMRDKNFIYYKELIQRFITKAGRK